jgi:magnesium transporter
VSAVAGVFEASVKHFPLILAFQPLILGMAGNAGTQSLAITLGRIDASEGGGWRRILWRELKTAFFSGLVLGALSFLVVGSFLFAVGKKGAYAFALGGCVGGAMCLSVMLAGLLGALIPLLLYRLHIDPAVASGPLLTTVNDIVAIVSYYGLAMLFLRPLV